MQDLFTIIIVPNHLTLTHTTPEKIFEFARETDEDQKILRFQQNKIYQETFTKLVDAKARYEKLNAGKVSSFLFCPEGNCIIGEIYEEFPPITTLEDFKVSLKEIKDLGVYSSNRAYRMALFLSRYVSEMYFVIRQKEGKRFYSNIKCSTFSEEVFVEFFSDKNGEPFKIRVSPHGGENSFAIPTFMFNMNDDKAFNNMLNFLDTKLECRIKNMRNSRG